MKSSRADSRVKIFIKSDFLETDSVPETSDFINILKRLSVRENFIEFRRPESLKTNTI
jgi:hypothetical protein